MEFHQKFHGTNPGVLQRINVAIVTMWHYVSVAQVSVYRLLCIYGFIGYLFTRWCRWAARVDPGRYCTGDTAWLVDWQVCVLWMVRRNFVHLVLCIGFVRLCVFVFYHGDVPCTHKLVYRCYPLSYVTAQCVCDGILYSVYSDPDSKGGWGAVQARVPVVMARGGVCCEISPTQCGDQDVSEGLIILQ